MKLSTLTLVLSLFPASFASAQQNWPWANSNLSALNQVGTGADVLIAGFTITGTGTKNVLIRAVGPTLGTARFNIGGVLVDPKLEIYNSSQVKIDQNDTWSPALTTTFSTVGAFPLTPGSKDAALILTLPPRRLHRPSLRRRRRHRPRHRRTLRTPVGANLFATRARRPPPTSGRPVKFLGRLASQSASKKPRKGRAGPLGPPGFARDRGLSRGAPGGRALFF